LGERQVAELVENDEVHAAEIVGHAALAAGTALGLELVDQVDDVEEAAAGTVADAGAGDRDRQVALPRAGAADQHDVALVGEEVAAGKVAHQSLVDRRSVEGKVGDILGQGQLGDGDLVLDRARLLLGDLGGEQITDHPLRLVLALHRGGDDLVEGGLHAVELQLAHGGQDLGAFHHTALLRLS
jgi:hypothetical protein